ncbi:MAG: aminotransferase class V-fold PLP-dependent enzyme [Eubacteriales bacterium]|nr:aminotransferase class V-fold PLP-dependent enzyme [Eubacteriales bacterium]
MIYLDNAATALPKPPPVIAAVTEAMQTLGNASRGSHQTAMAAARTVYRTRVQLGQLFGCAPERVCFTMNATAALNIAIQGAISRGSHVLTTDMEHNSVLRPLHKMADEGRISLDYIPVDEKGCLRYECIEKLCNERTAALVCTQASNLTGNTVDLKRLGDFAKKRGLLFIVDASQGGGLLDIDMRDCGIDILCFTGHKAMLGPQGIGGLCVADGVEVLPLAEGGSGVQSYERRQPMELPTRLECGTLNTHAIAGLSAALSWMEEQGRERVRRHEQELALRFYQEVSGLSGIRVLGDFEQAQRAPVVSLCVDGYDSAEVADILATEFNIATRPGAHCAPRLHQALGTKNGGAVRFSFSYGNTMEEVTAAVEAIKSLL